MLSNKNCLDIIHLKTYLCSNDRGSKTLAMKGKKLNGYYSMVGLEDLK